MCSPAFLTDAQCLRTHAVSHMSEQPSSLVQEEEFAKQLRLARHLAGASLPPSRRALEPVRQPKTRKGSDLLQRRGLKPRRQR